MRSGGLAGLALARSADQAIIFGDSLRQLADEDASAPPDFGSRRVSPLLQEDRPGASPSVTPTGQVHLGGPVFQVEE